MTSARLSHNDEMRLWKLVETETQPSYEDLRDALNELEDIRQDRQKLEREIDQLRADLAAAQASLLQVEHDLQFAQAQLNRERIEAAQAFNIAIGVMERELAEAKGRLFEEAKAKFRAESRLRAAIAALETIESKTSGEEVMPMIGSLPLHDEIHEIAKEARKSTPEGE